MFGEARWPFDEWLDGIDELQLEKVGHDLGSTTFSHATDPFGETKLDPKDQRALEDLFSAFGGKQAECLYRSIASHCENEKAKRRLDYIKESAAKMRKE